MAMFAELASRSPRGEGVDTNPRPHDDWIVQPPAPANWTVPGFASFRVHDRRPGLGCCQVRACDGKPHESCLVPADEVKWAIFRKPDRSGLSGEVRRRGRLSLIGTGACLCAESRF